MTIIILLFPLLFCRYLLSGGTAYFAFVTLNDAVCASNLMIWEVFENYSNYAVVAMMIERCIVVFLPLHSKILVTRRFTVGLLCVCVLPCWIALVPVSGFVLGVQPNSAWSANGVFCGWYQDRAAFPFYLWAYQLIIFTIHVVVAGVLVVILSSAIAHRQRRRRHLILTHRDSGGEGGKEYSAIVIMLLIAGINVVIFIPGLVSMLMSYLIDSSSWSQSAQNTLANFGRFALDIPCIAHSFNFLVYFARIPTFRYEISNVFSCCLAR